MIDPLDAQLLAAAQGGDYDAFEALHNRLEPALSRFVRRLIGTGAEAEDVVQDTLLALYMHLGDMNPPEKLRPFIFRVARNRCYDILRHQGRWDQVELEDDESPITVQVSFDRSGETPTPEDAVGWMMLYMEVKEAMDRLPELQRQTLMLFCEEDFSYSEIAEVMDVSMGTVKSRLFHAKKNLRGLLRTRTLAAIEESLGLWDDEDEDDVGDGVSTNEHDGTASPTENKTKGENHGTRSGNSGKTASLRAGAAGTATVGRTDTGKRDDRRGRRNGGTKLSRAASKNQRTSAG